MLHIMIPKELLEWMYEYKCGLSLPSLIIKSLAYVKNEGIELEVLIEKTNKKRYQKRGNYERIEGTDREGEDINISTM